MNTSDCSINWKYPLSTSVPAGDIHSSCGISPVDGTIYVGYQSTLVAVNPDSTLKWSYPTGDNVWSSPSVASDGTIYVGCDDKYLHAIKPDGTFKWKYETGGAIISSPAIGSDGTIYVGSNDGKLYAINPDGSWKWEYNTGGAVKSSPAVGSDSTIYVGSNDGKLYAINPDGSWKWEYNTGNVVMSSPAVDDVRGVVYVGNSEGFTPGNIYAIHTTGGLKWQTPLSMSSTAAHYSSPAVAYTTNTVYIGDYDEFFYVIDGETGHKICSNKHTWEITSPAIDDTTADGKKCVWYNEWSVAVYKVCCPGGIGAEEKCSCVRDKFHLHLSPNPFATATKISFTLPVKTHILLEVYDVSGRLIEVVARGNYDTGEHTVEWNTNGMRKGIYFCKLRTETHTLIRKMILMGR